MMINEQAETFDPTRPAHSSIESCLLLTQGRGEKTAPRRGREMLHPAGDYIPAHVRLIPALGTRPEGHLDCSHHQIPTSRPRSARRCPVVSSVFTAHEQGQITSLPRIDVSKRTPLRRGNCLLDYLTRPPVEPALGVLTPRGSAKDSLRAKETMTRSTQGWRKSASCVVTWVVSNRIIGRKS
jgi:hypothetical protein